MQLGEWYEIALRTSCRMVLVEIKISEKIVQDRKDASTNSDYNSDGIMIWRFNYYSTGEV
jgi:hypothetical protein